MPYSSICTYGTQVMLKVPTKPMRSLFTPSVDSCFLAGTLKPVLESPWGLVLIGLGLLLLGCGVAGAWLFPLWWWAVLQPVHHHLTAGCRFGLLRSKVRSVSQWHHTIYGTTLTWQKNAILFWLVDPRAEGTPVSCSESCWQETRLGERSKGWSAAAVSRHPKTLLHQSQATFSHPPLHPEWQAS